MHKLFINECRTGAKQHKCFGLNLLKTEDVRIGKYV